MAQYVEVNGQNIEFPDGMPVGDIEAAIKKNILSIRPVKESTPFQSLVQGAGNLAAGAVRGAGSIGATLMRPFDTAQENAYRRQNMDDALQSMGAEPDSWMYKGGKLGGEIAGTAGAGGLVARGLSAIPAIAKYAAPVLDAISSSGATSGGLTGWGGVGARALGGGVSGATQVGMVDPNGKDVLLGGGIGAAVPVALQGLGNAGLMAYSAFKSGKAGSGKLLANALGVSEQELPGMITALENAPKSLVNGSDLTFAQALQQQGANTPSAKLLEKVVSQGPGGSKLAQRYQDQALARLQDLQNNGAQTYQGAAKSEATMAGDQLGAILRTQAGDDKQANSAIWKALTQRATDDGVALQFPLEQMRSAMGPLGNGSVGMGADARALMGEANRIGTMELPAGKLAPAGRSQSLEQAVRAMGGIRPTNGYLDGELAGLTNRQSGTTGLVSKMGADIDRVTAAMHERGFIPENDPAVLLGMLNGGGGRNVFANDVTDNAFARRAQAAMGDVPGAERITVPVQFDAFQRLRSSAGELAAKAGNAGNNVEAGVLNKIKGVLEGRVNDASSGNLLPGEVMPDGFGAQYGAARDATRKWYERYGAGNNIESILRKPVGQDYTLTGDEILNKLWHGGSGLAGDVANLKGVLSANNFDPAMNALRQSIMTDAASKTTAGGLLGAGLPRYVETRMPGLLEAMTPEQVKSLSSVASDIRNAEAASTIAGTAGKGSDSYAKIANALDGGLLDSSVVKLLGRVKGLGALREKASEIVTNYKSKSIAELLASPADAAQALRDASFVKTLSFPELTALRSSVNRGASLLAAD